MKTDQLIQAMAADTTRQRSVESMLLLLLGAIASVTGLAFFALMGIRSDLADALGHVEVIAKQGLPILLAVAALMASCRLARPGCTAGKWSRALVVAPALALIAFVMAALSTPVSTWRPIVANANTPTCIMSILLLGLPILGASLLGLRHGASLAPGRSGALAGLLSGGIAAALYAFYCDQDSPMFWALWYSAGIALVTGVGFVAGRRLLRW